MESKVYYGDYSLAYWIELMVRKHIVLPQYQRFFVWKPNNVKALVTSIRESRFIPPITIGAFNDGNVKQDLILDGQQRLTSLLLAALGVFPKYSAWQSDATELGLAGDDEPDSDLDIDSGVVEWTYCKMLDGEVRDIDELMRKCLSNKYDRLDSNVKLTEDELKNCYMGFCYLVPSGNDAQMQQSYYAHVFRDLNINTMPLNILDSRRSLYFLKSGMDELFEPEFTKQIYLIDRLTKKKKQRIDFVRYLALIDEYINVGGNSNKIAKGFNRNQEQYFTQYIGDVVGEENGARFRTLSAAFNGKSISQAVQTMKEQYVSSGLPAEYSSIVDMDMAFFGLVYSVLYLGKILDENRRGEFIDTYHKTVADIRSTDHLKSPSKMANLRNRIDRSVRLYEEFSHVA